MKIKDFLWIALIAAAVMVACGLAAVLIDYLFTGRFFDAGEVVKFSKVLLAIYVTSMILSFLSLKFIRKI